jgi:2-keto-3-deoxy-L-rhamnonate aldolase RhmA
MRENHLRETMESGEPSLGTRIMNAWPGVIEVLGQTDAFDYVEFLAEYAPYDLHDLEHIGRAADLAGLSAMIKIDAENRAFTAQRAMAAGIDNLLFADVRTVEDAREAVEAVRAEPEGKNGVRMDRRNGYVGGYASPEEVVEICADAVVAIMVEKKETVENLQDILAVEGVDMVQCGPADYSLSISKPGDRSAEEVSEAEQTTIETALDMGVAPRAEITAPADAEEYLDIGVCDFNPTTDLGILHSFWSEEGRALDGRLPRSDR